MQRFSYEAVDSKGRKVVDTVEAWDKDSLLINLQSRGMVLVRWLEHGHSDSRSLKRSKRILTAGELLQLTKDLGHLLKSDVPMDKALTIISDSAKQASIRKTARSLKESIQSGSTLSEAMAARSEDFNDMYVNMIRVGETGGVLPQIMEKLAQFMGRSQEIRKYILSSSIYPAILLVVGIISVLVIMGFVLPRFAGIFADLGQEVPFSTRLLILMSDVLRAWGWLLFILGGVGFGLLWRQAHTPKGKDLIDRFIMKLPLLGELIMEIQVSRFARTLGTLVLSGVPLLKALAIVKDVVQNSLVKTSVGYIHHQVKEGKRISEVIYLQRSRGIGYCDNHLYQVSGLSKVGRFSRKSAQG